MKKKKVAIIGTNGLPARYGGFETLTHHLILNLRDDFDFVVYCSKTPKAERLKNYNGAVLKYLPLKANGWQSVLYDSLSIIQAWFTVDILLVLGNSGAIVFPFHKLAKKKLVLNIGGIDWMRDKWNYLTRKYIYFSEKLSVKFADIVITDNQIIHDHYVSEYNCENIIIPYGGDHVLLPEITPSDKEKYPFLNEEYAISVSRAQEDNMIHVVIEAFRRMPSKKLVLISNWHISDYGKRLKAEYSNIDNIYLIDAVYQQKELDLLRKQASLYIHSHSVCGTAPSLVEAMNLNLPIISYDSPTNRASTNNSTLYFDSVESLMDLVQKLDKAKSNVIRKSMFELAKARYTWEIVSEEYKKAILH